jgi:RHS repeat-associated protein
MKYFQRCSMFLLAALLLGTGLLSTLVSANAAGEAITFYHHDHLGTPIMATNEAGEVLWIREYSAYGDPKTQGDAVAVGYAGHEYYPESNLTNIGARWYNSELGRFMSPDPVGFNAGNTLSFNRYLYGNNNPYTFYDPDGEYFDLAIEFVSIGFGISSAINNIKEGNYGSAALDVVGVAFDAGMALIPGVPGGVGILRQGAKHADDVVGVAKKVRTKFEKKIEKQMNKRGWSKDDINSTIENPKKTAQTRDTRWKSDGSRRDDPATAYIREDGHYVVRNNNDGTIVQISNRNTDNWKSPFE